ncbi:MAG: N-acetylmuramoyl-L-alanine amidase [Defluviitaleaceae bacterium]|nr:N-acetylmuramoyl-L-alanine amidase [Defluviitaleaceae bacterium]
MAILCVIAVALAAAMFFYDRNFDNAYAVPALAVAEDELTAPEADGVFSRDSHERVEALPPLIPMYWGAGVFFDPAKYKIILPEGVRVTDISYNFFRYIFEITLEGIDLPPRPFPLMTMGILPMGITQDGDRIIIRTRRGAFARYGPGYVQIIDPREAYHTIVVIDPGHGGIDTGAPSANPGAPSESEINLAITLTLLEIFDEPGVLLFPIRTTDVFIGNSYRYRLANKIGDYFISIHCNADIASRLSRGTLTLYGQAPGSRELAYTLQTALVDTLESQDRGIHYGGQFRILNGSQIPVALLELLFISNPQEATRLADPDTQRLIAQTLADVIAELPPAR